MGIDIRLLQCIQDRSAFTKLRGVVPIEALEHETRSMIQDIQQYFERFEHERVDPDTFKTWAFMFKHSQYSEDEKALYSHLIRRMTEPPPDGVQSAILSELHELRLATSIGNAVHKWNEGELPMLPDVVNQLLNRYKTDAGFKPESWIQDDINILLDEVHDNAGIRWRLDALNSTMRGLRPGDFGIVAARPDKGKTTFFASECTYMAQQLPEDKNIVWLNNEGLGKRIIPRLYQSCLGVPLSELMQKRDRGTLNEEYIACMGRVDKVRVHDIHGMYTGQVERIIEEANAGIVIVDMIDHIRGITNAGTGIGTRTDLQLEEMYKWFRELCVRYGFIGLASSQISADGDGVQFPGLSCLKDSKTGKQGACDFQLMIGARNELGWNNERYLSLPKNKLRREGFSGDLRATVTFRPDIARYEELQGDTI